MLSFKEKYNAYMAARKKANIPSLIIGALVLGGIFTLVILISEDWAFILWLLAMIAMVVVGLWLASLAYSLTNRLFLRCFFKNELSKFNKV